MCSAYFAPTYFSFAKTQPNVVIIGGGWGGLSAAKTLRWNQASVFDTVYRGKAAARN